MQLPSFCDIVLFPAFFCHRCRGETPSAYDSFSVVPAYVYVHKQPEKKEKRYQKHSGI